MTSEEVFKQFVPEVAVAYCNKLYEKLGFEFKIKKARQTKLGDYRFDPKTEKHIISVNNDLNPYTFLITYLHEVAHFITFEKFGNKVLPHGKEWKQCFKEVANPLLTEDVFDVLVLRALIGYFKNPTASSCSDPVLYQILRNFNATSEKVLLKELRYGDIFIFNKRMFKKLDKRRTRIICQEVVAHREYLISELAEVLRKE